MSLDSLSSASSLLMSSSSVFSFFSFSVASIGGTSVVSGFFSSVIVPKYCLCQENAKDVRGNLFYKYIYLFFC